jgi:hypothetical protein
MSGRLNEIPKALKKETQEAEHNREVELEWSTDSYEVKATVDVRSRSGVYGWTITDICVYDRDADKDLDLSNEEVQSIRDWVERYISVSHEHDDEDAYWMEYDYRESNHRDT